MNWHRDAIETLDTILTYGSSEDPLFARVVGRYREIACDLGQADRFEQAVREVLELKKHRRRAETHARGA
jgi:hypothetical protein